jgi:hypothetical protein
MKKLAIAMAAIISRIAYGSDVHVHNDNIYSPKTQAIAQAVINIDEGATKNLHKSQEKNTNPQFNLGYVGEKFGSDDTYSLNYLFLKKEHDIANISANTDRVTPCEKSEYVCVPNHIKDTNPSNEDRIYMNYKIINDSKLSTLFDYDENPEYSNLHKDLRDKRFFYSSSMEWLNRRYTDKLAKEMYKHNSKQRNK